MVKLYETSVGTPSGDLCFSVGYSDCMEASTSIGKSTTSLMEIAVPRQGKEFIIVDVSELEAAAAFKFLKLEGKFKERISNPKQFLHILYTHKLATEHTEELREKVRRLNVDCKYNFPLSLKEGSYSSVRYEPYYNEDEALRQYCRGAVQWQLFKTVFKLRNKHLCKGTCLFDDNRMILEVTPNEENEVVIILQERLASRFNLPQLIAKVTNEGISNGSRPERA